VNCLYFEVKGQRSRSQRDHAQVSTSGGILHLSPECMLRGCYGEVERDSVNR